MPRSQYESDAPRALWLREALAKEELGTLLPLQGQESVDVCIVGGGFTGLWTALHLAQLEPSMKVGLLESDICGAGASGANGGFAMTWWPKFATLKKMMSTDDALRLASSSQEAIAEIGSFCESHGIDAGFTQAGWLWVATNSSQLGSWDDTIAVLAAAGASPFRALSKAEVLEMGGSERHLGGVFEEGVATVQPASLARGLRGAALACGIRIWERTPMLDFNVGPSAVEVTVPGGHLTADQLVLATNAWMARYPEIRHHLLVLGSDVMATAPAPSILAAVGWTPGLAISDSRRLVHYYRTTSDGRVVFGKGGGRIGFGARMNRSTWSTPLRGPEVVSQFRRTYPACDDVAITDMWSGAVDYSSDSLPFFGHVSGSERVHFGVGFSGNGVGPSYLGGKILASMALRRDDEWGTSPMIRTPKTNLPPEPFRALGGRLVRAAMRSKEASEDRERKPSPLIRRLTELDPTSFVG